LFQFLRFRLFRRPQVATFAEHDRFAEEIVELFRMPVEEELCAPEVLAVPVPAAADEPLVAEHAPARSGRVAA
jgi:hypothetical protein